MVLIDFPFSDESVKKLRPALIVSSAGYHNGRREVVIAAITSNVTRQLFGDHLVSEWRSAGLLFPSTVTGIIRTIKQSMIRRRLGCLPKADLAHVEVALRGSLGL